MKKYIGKMLWASILVGGYHEYTSLKKSCLSYNMYNVHIWQENALNICTVHSKGKWQFTVVHIRHVKAVALFHHPSWCTREG